MKVFHPIFFTICALTSCACRQNQDGLPFEDIHYVNSFPYIYDVSDGRILETGLVGIRDIKVCDDSLMLIATQDKEGYVHAKNLRSGKLSKGAIKQGNGPGELLFAPYLFRAGFHDGTLFINDNRGNLLRWRPNDSFGDETPSVESIENAILPSSYDSHYVNDSTFLCNDIRPDALGQDRFLVKNGKRHDTASMEKLNQILVSEDDGFSFNYLATFPQFDTKRKLVVEAMMHMNLIHLYSLDGSVEKTICLGNKPDNLEEICGKGRRALIDKFTRVALFDNYFAAIFSGAPHERKMNSKKTSLPKIMFFDYEGNPKAELSLPDYANAFGIDSGKGVLFTFDTPTETIREYDISEAMTHFQ